MDCDIQRFALALTTTAHLLGLTGTIGLLPSLIAPVLFLGPMYVQGLFETLPLQRNWSFNETVFPLFFSIMGFRNHVVVRNITEESPLLNTRPINNK